MQSLTLNHHSVSFPRQALLQVENLRKSFILHQQGGMNLSVLEDVSLSVNAGNVSLFLALPVVVNLHLCAAYTLIIALIVVLCGLGMRNLGLICVNLHPTKF